MFSQRFSRVSSQLGILEAINIQVLKDIPAEQLIPPMNYISASLGVRCQFCHVPRHPEKDDKKEKVAARKMIQMMFVIDNDNFEGRKGVTCYTCHRGSPHPARAIEISQASGGVPPPGAPPPGAMEPADGQEHEHNEDMAPPANAPATSFILARCTAAMGTADAVAKFSTSVEEGTLEIPSEKFLGAVEIDRMAPNMVLTILQTPEGILRQAYDGKVGWQKNPRGRLRDLTGPELTDLEAWRPSFQRLTSRRPMATCAWPARKRWTVWTPGRCSHSRLRPSRSIFLRQAIRPATARAGNDADSSWRSAFAGEFRRLPRGGGRPDAVHDSSGASR
jgi:hypothetical protein